jgi:hypothetical protein
MESDVNLNVVVQLAATCFVFENPGIPSRPGDRLSWQTPFYLLFVNPFSFIIRRYVFLDIDSIDK